MKHNRKEIQLQRNRQGINEHNRKVRVENMKNRVKVQNYLTMENQERFKNVVLGYTIQAERILNFVQSSTTGTITDETKAAVEQATKLMKKVQLNLLLIEDIQEKYKKHLHNSIWCKFVISPYVKKLEQIIVDADALVKGGDDNE